MAASLHQTLVSARLVITFGHFIALLTLFSTVDENVNLALAEKYGEDEREKAMQTAWAALIFAFFCFLFDFSGIFFGTTLFYHSAHLLNIFLHFVGGVFMSWLITQQWTYRALWPLVLSTNLPSALYEVTVLLGINAFRIIVY